MAQAAQTHTDHGHGNGGGGHGHGAHEPHSPMYYVKIWALLLGLLVISIMGPMLGNKILTVITAFGIAIIKALIVAAFFMHLNVERKYIWYIMFSMLCALGIFYFGTAADTMRLDGRNWTKASQYEYIENSKKAIEEEEKAPEARNVDVEAEKGLAPAPIGPLPEPKVESEKK